MPSLIFQQAEPVAEVSPNRADIVCFIGFVARRAGPLPQAVKNYLRDHGWRNLDVEILDDDPLLDTPVPVESFEAFEQLFAWEQRPAGPNGFAHPTWLGAAVRSFFRQGGARCLIVRVGLPWAYEVMRDDLSDTEKQAWRSQMDGRLLVLLPGLNGGTAPSTADRGSWRGIGALLGLDEAAFVCLPDLPELIADAATEPAGLEPLPAAPETFVECSPPIAPIEDEIRQLSSAPACTSSGCVKWFSAARFAAQFVRRNRKDVQLLLAAPLLAESKAASVMKAFAPSNSSSGLAGVIDETSGIASAFLQLAYPWLFTSQSEALPGGIEPPDATLAGVAARSVAARGAYRSLGSEPLRLVHGFIPELPQPDLKLDVAAEEERNTLIYRVSLLGPTPTGPRVLSDVTTSLQTAHRPACIGRLTAAILRTAGKLGEALVFEPAGAALWKKIEGRLDALLADFYAAGALDGVTRADAYSVRCDETTTTQNDIDNGRVIVEVRFAPAYPIGLITVVLALRDGSVSVTEGAT
jgi:uncharacterized protein